MEPLGYAYFGCLVDSRERPSGEAKVMRQARRCNVFGFGAQSYVRG